MPTSTRGGATLPPNPISGRLTGQPGVQSPVHLAPGGLEQLEQQTEAASAPANAKYNRISGTTGGVRVGMNPHDLAQIRALGRANPGLTDVIPSLYNPIDWARFAVEGGKQAAHGVSEAAHGHLAHGALDVGAGGLGLAAITPFGKFGRVLGNDAKIASSPVKNLLERLGVSAKPQGLADLEKMHREFPTVQTPEAVRGAKAPVAGEGAVPDEQALQVEKNRATYRAALANESGHFNLGAFVREPVRTPEEAQAHIDEVVTKAKAEGYGGAAGSKGNPPLVPRGETTDETGGELGQKIREALVHAPAVRATQKAGYSAERTDRVRAAAQASLEAGGGMAGHLAAKRHLAGELPKEFFGHLKDFTSEDLHQAAKTIDKAPLQFFEKTRAKDALAALVNDGAVPNKGDHALLERVFGRVAGEQDPQAKLSSFWDKFVSLSNVPRAVRSSADVSAGFRQGLMVLVTHPGVFQRQWRHMIKEFGSQSYYDAQMAAIHDDPLYPLMKKWGVPFTEVGNDAGHAEEAFIGGNAAERLNLREVPGLHGMGKYGTGPGDIVKASDRAFTGFQNGTRAELFKILVEKAAKLGVDLNDDHAGESIARVVGTFTGRGTVPKVLADHVKTMNALMFSPRLMASRLNLMSPVYYAKLDPFARREAFQGAASLVAAIGATMFVAKLLGAQVNFDPRSSNFSKIKIGNTRIDIAGGFSQQVRFVAQEMTREAISSAGHEAHIGWGQHDISDLANTTKLFRSKAAPIPSLLWDEASGKDFIGRPVKQAHELWSNAPFLAQDALDAGQQSGKKSVVIAAFLSAIGLGVQSYKDKPGARPIPKDSVKGLPPMPSVPLPVLPALPSSPARTP